MECKTGTGSSGSHSGYTNHAGTPIATRRSDLMLRFALLLSATIFTPLPGVAATPTAMIPPSPNVSERYLLNAANQERTVRGLPMLHNDPVLAQAARYHAVQMAEHGDISHQFPGEPDLTQRGADAGVHFSLITENVAEASDSTIVHNLWMHSEGHRENLLDPEVDSVGIAVISHGGQIYAVEDFASTVDPLTFSQQEQVVADTLARAGLIVGSSGHTSSLEDARRTCTMDSGYAGEQNRPRYIIRYTADRLDQIPDLLAKRIGTNKYRQAVVGACTDTYSGPFSAYNIAVLLYP